MAREITTSIDIAAPASAVWAILTDFGELLGVEPICAPDQRRLAGRREAGGVAGYAKPQPHVHPADADQGGRRSASSAGAAECGTSPASSPASIAFAVQPVDENSVRFVHDEHFTGVVVPFIWGKMVDDTTAGFVTMNEALKRLAEAG